GVDCRDISLIGTRLTLSDDTPSEPIQLPFTFEFFGRLYGSLTVSPNGFVTFAPAPASDCQCQGTELPDARGPNALIAALWKDLDPSRGGSVNYTVVGAPPDRRFLLQFTNVPDAQRPGVTSTWQLALVETTNEIEVRYAGASGGDRGAAAGLEDETGSSGLTWLLGGFTLDRAAVRYTPLHIDTDHDGVMDCIDNCRLVENFAQTDSDGDGPGDPCDLDGPPVTVGAGAPKDKVAATTPAVALDSTGNAIVVWDGDAGTDRRGIMARWFDRSATPIGNAFAVNVVTDGDQLA